jgi:hypothetical protein
MVQESMSARDQILGKIEPLAEVSHPGAFKDASENFDFKAALEVVGACLLYTSDAADEMD